VGLSVRGGMEGFGGGIADCIPATGEAREMLVDGVNAAQLGRGLVVVLPDLFRRSASCRSLPPDVLADVRWEWAYADV
jgi:hypothetical protein